MRVLVAYKFFNTTSYTRMVLQLSIRTLTIWFQPIWYSIRMLSMETKISFADKRFCTLDPRCRSWIVFRLISKYSIKILRILSLLFCCFIQVQGCHFTFNFLIQFIFEALCNTMSSYVALVGDKVVFSKAGLSSLNHFAKLRSSAIV